MKVQIDTTRRKYMITFTTGFELPRIFNYNELRQFIRQYHVAGYKEIKVQA